MFRVLVGTNDSYTNSYVVFDEKTKEGAIIDPAGEIDKIYNYIENMNIKLKYAILTHCHGDHIAGLRELKHHYPQVKVVVHELEKDALLDDNITLCSFLNLPENTISADLTVKDGDELSIGEMTAKILHTPGHTAGSMSILIEDAIYTRRYTF